MRMGFSSEKNIHYDWISLTNSYKKIVKTNDLVLEIGASSPERSNDLQKYCRQLIGIELLKERLPKNSKKIKYLAGDWQTLSKSIKINSVDIIVSSNTIEHIRDDLTALNEAYKVLKPGGTALINTPNRKRLTQCLLSFIKGEVKFPQGEHIREYTKKDLIKLIKKSRFSKYEIKPVVFGIHAGPLYVYLTKPPLLFRGLANFWEIHLFKNTK